MEIQGKCNFAIVVVLTLVINFILCSEAECKISDETKVKKFSKAKVIILKEDESNKNSAQEQNTEKNILDKNNINESKAAWCMKSFIENVDQNQFKCEVERIYNERSAAFVSGDVSSLEALYDTSQKYGKWALEHEIKRIKCLNDWGAQRNIAFGKVESIVRIKKVYPQGAIVKLVLEESYKFDYVYDNDENSPINSFGIGIRHVTSLIKKNEKWVIYNDWYTDCFEDSLNSYASSILKHFEEPTIIRSIDKTYEVANYSKRSYDRQKAVAYADKYCGAAWGNGNDYKYNKKYNDYTGIGGDCTNFTSQVLSDKEGGGICIGGCWTPGDRAWINADGLKDYLISSGKGSAIKVGTFKELTKSLERFSSGAVGKLQYGDLVAYEKGRGNIDHFAIVTGFDSHGYPLVNSHTTDRYHVPWDLGWNDAKIRFFLIHINR